MRTLLLASLGLCILASASMATATPQDEADEVLDDLEDRLGLGISDPLDGKEGSGTAPNSGSHGSAPRSGLGAVVAAVVAPIEALTEGVVSLGLGLLDGFFAGMGQAAGTFVDAASLVASAPAESAVISAAAIGTVGLLGALAYALQRYGTLGALPLFSRIARSELLENKLRSDIFELIRASPGINVSEISRRLDIAWGTTTHHLHKLRAEKLVAIRLVARQKCYFLNGGTFTPREMDVMGAVKQPTARRIADYLVSHGAVRHQDLVTALGLSPALVSYHLSKLTHSGIVQGQREGRHSVFRPVETNLTPDPRPVVHTV